MERELHNLCQKFPPEIRRISKDLVDLPENADFQSFQESTALNAGMSFKWFTDIDAART